MRLLFLYEKSGATGSSATKSYSRQVGRLAGRRNGIRLAPIMFLKLHTYYPFQNFQKNYPLFLNYSHIITYYSFIIPLIW